MFLFCFVSISAAFVVVWIGFGGAQARLSRYLKMLYTEWALKESHIPHWTNGLTPGTLAPSRLEPEFRLHTQSHGVSDPLTVDQLLLPIQVHDLCPFSVAFARFSRPDILLSIAIDVRKNLCPPPA